MASARNLHISPRKLRLTANLVKGMPVGTALEQLKVHPSKGAPMVYKVVASAVANAVNNFQMQADHLFVKTIFCDGAQVLKRNSPRARGSAFMIRRRLAHVTVGLAEGGKVSANLPKKRTSSTAKKTQGEMAGKTTPITKLTKGVSKVTKRTQTSEVAKRGRATAARRPDDAVGER